MSLFGVGFSSTHDKRWFLLNYEDPERKWFLFCSGFVLTHYHKEAGPSAIGDEIEGWNDERIYVFFSMVSVTLSFFYLTVWPTILQLILYLYVPYLENLCHGAHDIFLVVA